MKNSSFAGVFRRKICYCLLICMLMCVSLHSRQAAAVELPATTAQAANQQTPDEMPMLRLTPDKPQTVRLEREAVNVLIGNDTHLHIIPDTSKNLILMPRVPGTTYFTVLDAKGDVIMQRHVVVAPPRQNYVRIRRACPAGDRNCEPYSMYYCPDICHEMAVPVPDNNPEALSAPDEVLAAPVNDLSVEDGVAASDLPPQPPTFVPSAELQQEAALSAEPPPVAKQ